MVVAFSCKRRGFCPSCTARRMSDIAAHLVEEVLPEVPIRQWVCSLPWRLRTALAYDRGLCADVLDAFVSSLTRSLRRRAKKHLGLRSMEDALTDAVTFVQRTDSALRPNVHAHTLALDGVRAHRGALIPIDAVSVFDASEGGSLVLRDGTRIPVSRRAIPVVRAALGLDSNKSG